MTAIYHYGHDAAARQKANKRSMSGLLLAPQAGCKGTHEERMQFADSDAGCAGMPIGIGMRSTQITQPVAKHGELKKGLRNGLYAREMNCKRCFQSVCN